MERKVDLSKLTKIKNWIEISAMKNIGIDEMEDKIYHHIVDGNVKRHSSQKITITNVRHKSALEKTKQYVENIFETIRFLWI